MLDSLDVSLNWVLQLAKDARVEGLVVHECNKELHQVEELLEEFKEMAQGKRQKFAHCVPAVQALFGEGWKKYSMCGQRYDSVRAKLRGSVRPKGKVQLAPSTPPQVALPGGLVQGGEGPVRRWARAPGAYARVSQRVCWPRKEIC